MQAQQHREVSTDHLGNVRATVSDMLIPRGSVVFDADLRTLTDYYPFGMTMPGRTLSSEDYRYGYNTQERVDEIAGEGNHYTAEYWEYDPRAARRWNLDPRLNLSFSPYQALELSPIKNADVLGDSVWGYSELVVRNGIPLGRHTFLRVKTTDRDVVIELWGPKEGETVLYTGRPKVLPWDNGNALNGRNDVETFMVERPKDSPEGDEKFENRLIKLAEYFSQSITIDEKVHYLKLPIYEMFGPNSNGYIEAITKMSGGDSKQPFNAFGESDVLDYVRQARRDGVIPEVAEPKYKPCSPCK